MVTKRFLVLIFWGVFSISMYAQNEKPFVIPELKEWVGMKGMFTLNEQSQIFCPEDNSELFRIASSFVTDYEQMFKKKLSLSQGKKTKGGIVFRLCNDKQLKDEGYAIAITTSEIQVSANKPIGIYWATRTLLQMLEQDANLPCGKIKDFPDYAVRGFMLDCGRKFIPLEFLRDYVRIMSYYKMNTFQIHLNDNAFPRFYNWDLMKTYSAFRLQSDTYPGLAAQDGFYTKQEFIDLQKLAENHFVDIIPEIDVPAHSLAFTQYKPEIGSKKYGMDHLDLFNPETYKFLDELFKEYLEGDEPVLHRLLYKIC